MNLHRITDHCCKVWKLKKSHSDARAKYLVVFSVSVAALKSNLELQRGKNHKYCGLCGYHFKKK
jgi:hypothetical protein